MTTMWTCKFCEKPVAPNASKCPACGGHFGVAERGYMRGQARVTSRAQSNKSKNVGCSIFLVPLLGAGIWLASSVFGEASEWEAFGKNNAMVTSADGKLIIHCESGEGSSLDPGISFFIEPTKTLPPSKGMFWGIFNRVKGELIGGGERVRFDNDRWILWSSIKGTLKNMKAGSEILFRYDKDQYLTFPLTGSSKALDECFKPIVEQDTYAHSKVDIIGIKTGMAYSTVAKQVTKHLGVERVDFNDTDATYFGTTTRSNTTIKFDYSATWRKSEPHLREYIKVTLSPDLLGKRVLTTQRDLFYETSGRNSKPPLFKTIYNEGLKAKYGNPSIWYESNDKLSGSIVWFFNPDTGKAFGESYPIECFDAQKIHEPTWNVAASTQNYSRFENQYSQIAKTCGPYIKVKYDKSGQFLKNLTTTMVDVPLIFDTVMYLYRNLKSATDTKEEKLLKQSSDVKTKF
ncbi:hypothetical protein [Lentilitoribacter sp. Alg239-R112]|uniref:hypothetical protein n=2 Tax=unclassified Lentilitoribacter TaxID=2647570 RepID=UPI0013A6D1ED|nr:hypothetical protein [Lentilitoribacter sp. Alg239-R112]